MTDLPHSTRSVTDLRHRRIYLPQGNPGTSDARSPLLQAIASHVLGHAEPSDYGDFLRQRVEANYLAAALMLPEDGAAPFLQEAKAERRLSVEDLRDAFARALRDGRAPVHQPGDAPPRHPGALHEGPRGRHPAQGVRERRREVPGRRRSAPSRGSPSAGSGPPAWCSRCADRFTPYYQYTDTSSGTYWCTSRVQPSSQGAFSVSRRRAVRARPLVPRAGRPPSARRRRCPDPMCCRQPPDRAGASAGPTSPGPAPARTRPCWPRCPSGCSRAWTRPRSTGSWTGTRRRTELPAGQFSQTR